MTDCYFTFRSITKAQSGERALHRERIRYALLRTPKKLSLQGCGYALKVPYGEAGAAAAALRLWNVDYGKIYRVTGGEMEEIVL